MKRIETLTNHWITYAGMILLIMANNIHAIACEACRKQQPKLLQGITHGAGPDGNWDYVIAFIMVLITLYVLIASVRCIIQPSEKGGGHIKRIILND
jgi:hypothetical protein